MIDDATLDAMDRFGGSFIRTLARLYRVADEQNRLVLVHAFSEYFARYAALAKERQEEPT
jgi:alpha-beta hydrolase superfamily lysophospholipase